LKRLYFFLQRTPWFGWFHSCHSEDTN